MAGSRKRRYLQHLAVDCNMKAVMPPDPCSTRWHSWFAAVEYHKQHFSAYEKFISDEMSLSKSPPESLEKLHAIFSEKKLAAAIKVQIDVIAEKCSPITKLTDVFQSCKPIAMSAYDNLEDLMINFTNNSMLAYESMNDHFDTDDGDELTFATKSRIVEMVQEESNNVLEKLSKYMGEGQPGIEFLKQVRLFNPAKITLMPREQCLYTALPGIGNVTADEWSLYFDVLAPEAVRSSVCGIIDTDTFWVGQMERLPMLAKIAIAYKDAVTNSAQVERSNSIYNVILGARRRSLSEQSIRCLLFLQYNNLEFREADTDW